MSSHSVTRWAGTVVGICSTIFTITIVLYLAVYGAPAGTGADGAITIADRAAHASDRWGFISTIWLIEAIAWVLLAVAALSLAQRRVAGRAWLPAPIAWVAVGVGALLQSTMYGFMLGGYPAAIADMPASVTLFDAMNDAATFLFYLSGAAFYFGLAGVLLGEATAEGAIPRWVALGGAAVCLIETALVILALRGIGGMMMVGPLGLLGFLLAAWTGFAIARSDAQRGTPRSAEPAGTTTRSPSGFSAIDSQ